MYAKLEEMQKTVARLGDDDNAAQADQVIEWPESNVPSHIRGH